MIQTHIKACKPEADKAAFEARLVEKANHLRTQGDEDGDIPEGVSVIKLTEANFEEHWADQENLNQTPEAKAKYLQYAKEGRAWAIEVEW